jgi:hypothetical protein
MPGMKGHLKSLLIPTKEITLVQVQLEEGDTSSLEIFAPLS